MRKKAFSEFRTLAELVAFVEESGGHVDGDERAAVADDSSDENDAYADFLIEQDVKTAREARSE